MLVSSKNASVAFLVGSALLLGACVIVAKGNKADFALMKPSLSKTASFDLGCPAEQLSFLPVGAVNDGYDKVGVSGCGKKATYVEADNSWIKNSETRAE